MYRYFSHGELVGHSGPELPRYPGSPTESPRLYVFVPGPAFRRVWPALLALQRAGAATMQALLAAQAAGRLPPLPPGAAPEEIRAHYAGILPMSGTEVAAVRALALELHDESGPLERAGKAMVVEYPSAVAVAVSPEAREEMARIAPGLGFAGDPPYYALAVPPHL